jgi:hypothetical protein
MLEGYRSPFDATVVAQLAKAGAVTLGKLNCDEFAMGSSNENSAFGAPQPWDTSAFPAARRAAARWRSPRGWLPAATGTDTGGSIRQPAALLPASPASSRPTALLALRHDRLRLQPRPGRPAGAHGRGLRAAASAR